MVVGHHKVIGAGPEGNQRCVTLETALIEGQRHEGIPVSLALIQAMREQRLRYDEVNVPVTDQPVTVQNSGCIPEHESVTHESRVVVGNCPTDSALRCANCILNLPNGPDLLDSLRPWDLKVSRS